MCGIVGQLDRKNAINRDVFDAMRDTLTHRGPDGFGTWMSGNAQVALGHRRLSFLDLSEKGKQPMCDAEQRYHITFNGEIYNYLELRKILESEGMQFRTRTDTEVILLGYKYWGKELIQRLKGMFAFGIWDAEKRKLLLVRDRFGIKPLYFLHNAEQFIFASEIKAIKKCRTAHLNVDFSSVCDYFTYRFIPSPKSIWKEVGKLPPAHYLEFDFDTFSMSMESYWQLKPDNKRISHQEAVEEVHSLLSRSVKNHLRSDVPVGAFLSGGYDSSALAYFMAQSGRPPETFTIGFQHWEKSEDQYAQIVADELGLELHKTIVGNEQLSLLPRLMYHYDEPIADISIIPTYMVSRLASGKVKTVFSGEGADEIFVGYEWQKEVARQKQWSKDELLNHYGHSMSMGQYGYSELKQALHPDYHEFIPERENDFYASSYPGFATPLRNCQYMDIRSFMGELVLTKVDRASMAHSLEVRVPFLDYELVEFMFSLDKSVFYHPKVTKWLLHEQIKDTFPKSILNRRKQGFVGPDRYYMNFNWYVETLSNGRLLKDGILQKNALVRMVAKNDHWRLWKWAVLEHWWQQWV